MIALGAVSFILGFTSNYGLRYARAEGAAQPESGQGQVLEPASTERASTESSSTLASESQDQRRDPQGQPASDIDLSEVASTVIVKGTKPTQNRIRHERASLRDTLEDQGAWGVMSGGAGSRLEVQVRGSGGHQNGVYLDEIPLHSLRGQSVDLSLLPLGLLSGAEVERGGDGVNAGSGALGGQLKLTSASIKRGAQSLLLVGGGSQRWGRLNALWGYGASADEVTPQSVTPSNFNREISHRDQVNGALLGLSISGGPNPFPYRDARGMARRRSRSGFSHSAIFTKSQFHWRGHQLRFSGGLSALNREEPGPEGLTLPGRQSDQRMIWGVLNDNWHQRVGGGLLTTKLRGYYLGLDYLFVEEVPLWQAEQDRSLSFSDQRVGVDLNLKWDLDFLELGSGVQISSTQALTQDQVATREQAALSPYVKVALTPKLTLKVGTRGDFNTERSPQLISSARLMWRADTVPLSSWIGWSQVWRDPGFDERMMVGPGLVPNPNLIPERGDWGDLGAQVTHRGYLGGYRWRSDLSLSGFVQRYADLITYVPLDPYRVRAENLSGAEVFGVESALKISMRFGEVQVRVAGDISALHHQTLDQPQAPLPLRPQTFGSARLSVSQRLRQGELSGWLKLGGRGEVTVDRFGGRRLPPRSLLSFGLSRTWRLSGTGGHLTWALDLDNLLNQSTYDFALSPLPGRSAWCSFIWKR